jgi:tetratricopeptide (TPR) repeat protein
MVLDNADDKEVLFGANAQAPSRQSRGQELAALIDYIPRSSIGSTLVTTRDRRVGERLMNREKPIAVVSFEVADAKQLLRNKLPKNDEWDEAASMELLESLNFLPLAITQAAAYISEEEVSLAHYLDLLRPGDVDAKDLLEQAYYDPGRDSKIQNSIFLTWQISFDQITKQKPRAAEILSLMAVLDGQAISDMLLRRKDERKVNFDTAIGTLKAFSLVTEEKNGAIFNIHRLVQLSTQKWLELQHVLVEWQEKALNAVFANCPLNGGFENWATWETISPHVQVVLEYIFSTKPCQLKRASILRKASSYDGEQGQYGAAYEKGMEAQTMCQKLLGKEHPDTLMSMDNLALVLDSQGKYVEAEEMHRQVLKLRKKVLGKEHPDTLMSMNNLASVLDSHGKYVEAEEMNRQVLKLKKKVLGKEHPDTWTSMSNLASVLYSQSKYVKAEEMNRQVLKLREKMLGKEHPNTLTSMDNLSLVLDSQGKYVEAEEMYRQVLKLSEKVLGKEHSNTLMSMNNLASMLDSQGKYVEAEEMNRQVLKLREKVMGKEHSDTLTSMNNLSLVLDSQGKYVEAEEMYRQVLKLSEKVLGKEHPNTLTSMNNLASMLNEQGKCAKEMH